MRRREDEKSLDGRGRTRRKREEDKESLDETTRRQDLKCSYAKKVEYRVEC